MEAFGELVERIETASRERIQIKSPEDQGYNY